MSWKTVWKGSPQNDRQGLAPLRITTCTLDNRGNQGSLEPQIHRGADLLDFSRRTSGWQHNWWGSIATCRSTQKTKTAMPTKHATSALTHIAGLMSTIMGFQSGLTKASAQNSAIHVGHGPWRPRLRPNCKSLGPRWACIKSRDIDIPTSTQARRRPRLEGGRTARRTRRCDRDALPWRLRLRWVCSCTMSRPLLKIAVTLIPFSGTTNTSKAPVQ